MKKFFKHIWSWRLLVGMIIFFFFAASFFNIVEGLRNREQIVQTDALVTNWVQTIRTPQLTVYMTGATNSADWPAIAIILGAVGLISFFKKRWSYFLALTASVALGEIMVMLLKLWVARPRPPALDALLVEKDFSFPSGHAFAAMSLYGLLTFLLVHFAKNKFLKVLIFLLGLLIVLAIGFSRIYLGVHWLSDVLASYALGIAWLAIFITAIETKWHLRSSKNRR